MILSLGGDYYIRGVIISHFEIYRKFGTSTIRTNSFFCLITTFRKEKGPYKAGKGLPYFGECYLIVT